jgi:methyltransferase (TIGR00027 family)
VETSAPDHLIEDRYALWFVDASPVQLPMLTRWPEPGASVTAQQTLHLHGSRYIGLRTRFYDDWLREAADAGIRQAVLLGSGLDTRAFRIAWPAGFRLFEADQPGVLGFKIEVLADGGATAACLHTPVGVDLREDWTKVLLDAGFTPGAPTAWLAEGLLAYLPAQAEVELFERIEALSAPGSRVAFDRILGDLAARDGARLKQLSERSGVAMDTMVNTEERSDARQWFADHGWAAEQEAVAVLAQRYARDLADPFAAPETGGAEPPWLDTAFVIARRTC